MDPARYATSPLLVPTVADMHEAGPLQPVLAAITVLGSGRLGPTASAALGLVGTVLGGLALTRARGSTRDGGVVITAIERRGAGSALVLGGISLVLGILFLVTADGGPGTGNGVVGSLGAIVLGPIALVLGGLARARRSDAGSISPV